MQNTDLSGVTMPKLAALEGNLGNIDFTNANFSACNVMSLGFQGSNLQGARFHNASLKYVTTTPI